MEGQKTEVMELLWCMLARLRYKCKMLLSSLIAMLLIATASFLSQLRSNPAPELTA